MADPTASKYKESDPLKCALQELVKQAYNEDIVTRQFQLRHWKRLKYYWNNLSQIFWSDRENTYKVWGRDDYDGSEDQGYYDRPVNIFKAFLETIIAALSINVPAVACVPDDAENPLDLSTAKAGNKISELIYKHNDAILIWIKALYVYCTEGMIAFHTYKVSDKKYGTYEQDEYKDEEVEDYYCPSCGNPVDEQMISQAKQIEEDVANQFDPDADEQELANYSNEDEDQQVLCPQCSVAIDPGLKKSTLKIPRFVGKTTKAKSRIMIEVKGGLYVKVANYAQTQAETPYLIDMYETHYANALEAYEELRDKLPQGGWALQGVTDPYEQYARLNVQYHGTIPDSNVTVKNCWIRPAYYHILDDEAYNLVSKKYPNGCKVVMVNDVVAEHCEELLDDHWTLTKSPTSDYLTHEALGEVLVNIQDIVNDLISLTLQCIEHSVPQTFVDPAVVNVDAYGQLEIVPGGLTATKSVAGNKSIGEAFYATSTSTVNPEVFSFYKIIQELGQFVSGALPSIYGGAQPGGGDTASEYAQAKGMALQRLQTPWKMLTIAWKEVFGKIIPQYMEMLVECDIDDRHVQKDEAGNFVNTFIRRSEIQGKIGSVELEGSEQLPITDDQQRQIIMELMQLNNMEVFQSLTAPENLPYIKKIIRIPQYTLPGENDRQKQLEEIQELINTTPIPAENDPMTGQPIEIPSVQVDPILDDHKIEGDICRNWLIGDAGRLAKIENPQGYMNVMLHYQQHVNELAKKMQMQAMSTQMSADNQSGKQPNNPSKPSGEEKPEENKDVSIN